MISVIMFDEAGEALALYKATDTPPLGALQFLPDEILSGLTSFHFEPLFG